MDYKKEAIEDNLSYKEVEELLNKNKHEEKTSDFFKQPFSFYKSLKGLVKKELSKDVKIFMFIMLVGGAFTYTSFSSYQQQAESIRISQFTHGLFYNLTEFNNLNSIANNIYIGMKNKGMEPTVKISNSELFVFELNNNAEFTIRKDYNWRSEEIKYTVNVKNMSKEMMKDLAVYLEPDKIAGSNIRIIDKLYNPINESLNFSIVKPLNIPALSDYEIIMPAENINLPVDNSIIDKINESKNNDNKINDNKIIMPEKSLDTKDKSIEIKDNTQDKIVNNNIKDNNATKI